MLFPWHLPLWLLFIKQKPSLLGETMVKSMKVHSGELISVVLPRALAYPVYVCFFAMVEKWLSGPFNVMLSLSYYLNTQILSMA